MVVFSTMEPKTFQFQVLDPDIRVRYIKQVINPIRRGEGVTPMTSMALLHQWTYVSIWRPEVNIRDVFLYRSTPNILRQDLSPNLERTILASLMS